MRVQANRLHIDWSYAKLKQRALLEQSDKFMLEDFPVDARLKEAIKAWRQVIRDSTNIVDHPDKVQFPPMPTMDDLPIEE